MSYSPKGWVECELKDVFETSSGGTPKRGISAYYDGNIPWLKSGELNDGLITECEEYITEEGLKNSSAKIFPKGSLLIALYGATVGKLGVLNFNSSTNQAICCIYSNKNYNKIFLFYYLMYKKEYLVNRGKGGAQPNISQEIIKSLNIPLPPLNEQKRIVEKIEKEFEKIDKGIENLEKVKEQIKQYRQSVLHNAFNGNLYQLRTGWQEFELKDVCKNISAGGDKPKIYSETETELCKIPIYSNGIQNNGLYGYTDVARIVEPAVTVSARGTIGFVCVRKQPYLPIVRLISVIPDTSILNIEFLKYFLNYVVPKGEGSSIPQLTVPNFKKYIITLPSLDEQQKIVEEIEKRFKIADEVEKNIDKNLEKAKQLKQSILKKAFEGRLIPQDPTDEPASKLLERIKQERKINDRK